MRDFSQFKGGAWPKWANGNSPMATAILTNPQHLTGDTGGEIVIGVVGSGRPM